MPKQLFAINLFVVKLVSQIFQYLVKFVKQILKKLNTLKHLLRTNETKVLLTFVGYSLDVKTYPELNAADNIALPIDANIIISTEFHVIPFIADLGITATTKHIKPPEPKNPMSTFLRENLSFK